MSRTKEEKEALIRARRKAVRYKCLIEEAEEKLAEAVEEKRKNPSDEAQRVCFELESEIRDLTAKYNSAKIAADEYTMSDSDVKELAREDATDRAGFQKKDVMSDEEVIALAKM